MFDFVIAFLSTIRPAIFAGVVLFPTSVTEVWSPEDGLVPHEWLILPPTDRRGRRPFSPDIALATYLFGPENIFPQEGDILEGELGKGQAWKRVSASENGMVTGSIGTAFTEIVSPVDRVVLADLRGASRLWVNGEPFHGDVYRANFGPTPVSLRRGANQVFVQGIRGQFQLALAPVSSPVLLPTTDDTLPDLVSGEPVDALAGILLVNTLDAPQRASVVVGDGRVVARHVTTVDLPPLGVTKVPLVLKGADGAPSLDGQKEVRIPVRCGPVSRVLRLAVVAPDARRTTTFLSHIDRSIQKYAVVPPAVSDLATEKTVDPGLVLSLHGAGVDAPGQAASYHPKSDFWIVAPTNRRPFGFDWQDWGRADAYEVLAEGVALSGVDRRRLYLTGHSMGGHGVWHLAANDPDGFAAAAPSAGWAGFDSYGGRPSGTLQGVWQRADGASLTFNLLENLVQVPTYILHGGNDDNVPASEARALHEALLSAGGDPTLHIEPGQGHWWDIGRPGGADCVDWPEIFDLFRGVVLPEAPSSLAFTTVDPSVDAEHYWVTVEQLAEYGRPASVEAAWNEAEQVLEVQSDNVERMSLRPPATWKIKGWLINGELFDGAELSLQKTGEKSKDVEQTGSLVACEGGGAVWMRHGAGVEKTREKSPQFSGPLKQAFLNGFTLVVGTGGSDAENRAALATARYHAQTWWYRGNGTAPIVTDKSFLVGGGRSGEPGNVVLYGNAQTNRAWGRVLGPECPVDVTEERVVVGEQVFEGDGLALFAVRPRFDV
ncbi:MAG: prolyl oligopeptidase family serine peptidase, partial [Planctomycetota bacterium]|nr:prolyl oligopeptidase family serine peptidase [Planctomycetota bacterium]